MAQCHSTFFWWGKKTHHKSSKNLFAIGLSYSLGSTTSFSDSSSLCPLIPLRKFCFPTQKCLFSLYILLLFSSKMQTECDMKERFSAGLPANLKFSTQLYKSTGKTRLGPKTLRKETCLQRDVPPGDIQWISRMLQPLLASPWLYRMQ